MANRDQPFKQHLITRALRAASRAGVVNPSCTVQLPSGVTLVIGSAGPKAKMNVPVGGSATTAGKAGGPGKQESASRSSRTPRR